MVDISLCMIIKNEEKILKRCLDSVKGLVDEFIIVDTGSSDKSKEIAKEYDAKVYDFEWCDDFSKARNYSFSKATKDYILWLDADDYITKENLEKLIELKNTLSPDVDVVSMGYSLSRNSKGETTYSLRRNRIVKRKMGFLWKGRIHEYLDVMGVTIHSEAFVNHDKDKGYTNRNLTIFKLMKENNEEFTDRDRFYYANELYYNGEYKEAIEEYQKFIESGRGWIEDLKTATANIVQCYTFTNQDDKKIDYILNSFKWEMPRADICCRMAEEFLRKRDYRTSIFWYKTAMNCVPNENNMGFDVKDYYTWIPSIQLCVCYSNLGEYTKAYYYNEVTALYVPDSPKVKHNRDFLEQKLKELAIEIPKYDYVIKERL